MKLNWSENLKWIILMENYLKFHKNYIVKVICGLSDWVKNLTIFQSLKKIYWTWEKKIEKSSTESDYCKRKNI